MRARADEVLRGWSRGRLTRVVAGSGLSEVRRDMRRVRALEAEVAENRALDAALEVEVGRLEQSLLGILEREHEGTT